MNADLQPIEELIGRSNRLGSDRRVTNFGGGNTSAKGRAKDPTSGQDTEVIWVKGSGGDLGTLTVTGLATLRLHQVRSLRDVYHGGVTEDEIQQLLDHCLLGPGPAPSIDTSMHALLPARHVDHLHPDSVIAIAASADGEELTKRCFGDEVAWIPWIRPGFDLALQMAQLVADRPALKGVVLGGHGLTTWGDTSAECEANSLEVIGRAAELIESVGRPNPLGSLRRGFEPLPFDERRRRALLLAPTIRGLAGSSGRVVGKWWGDDLVADFVGREAAPRIVPMGTSCPDHFIRTKVRPMLLDVPATATMEEQVERLHQLHEEYRNQYISYYEMHATDESPAIRGLDPAVVLVPGVGMFSFGADSKTARLAGEYYISAINVMGGAEALSTYEPVSDAEKFRVEYWHLEELKLQRQPAQGPLTGKVAFVTGAGSGLGRAIAAEFANAGAVIAVVDIDLESARETADGIGTTDLAIAVEADVTDEAAVSKAVDEAALAFGGIDIVVNNAGISLSRDLLETTTEDWDRQHDVMSKGSFLVSKHAARVMIQQGRGGDIVYVVSKNSVVAGPKNLAYGSAKASQAHQVRLLAAELGPHGIRVNGINPDGVVQGSGIFANGWGAERAQVYGVPEQELGRFYAGRTLLGEEVLPKHVAEAGLVLVSGALSHTTGVIVPVDSGLPEAFLR